MVCAKDPREGCLDGHDFRVRADSSVQTRTRTKDFDLLDSIQLDDATTDTRGRGERRLDPTQSSGRAENPIGGRPRLLEAIGFACTLERRDPSSTVSVEDLEQLNNQSRTMTWRSCIGAGADRVDQWANCGCVSHPLLHLERKGTRSKRKENFERDYRSLSLKHSQW